MKSVFCAMLIVVVGMISCARAQTFSFDNGTLVVYPTMATAPALATKDITWTAGRDLQSIFVGEFPQGATIKTMTCRIEAMVGAPAEVSLVAASSGTALAKGRSISMPCNGNGDLYQDQSLLPATAVKISAGETVGTVTADSAAWIAGQGAGGLTLGYTVP